jgi:hypothetical protein
LSPSPDELAPPAADLGLVEVPADLRDESLDEVQVLARRDQDESSVE